MGHKRTGFTLVEILVVLGVITLLAGLMFPVFTRARERGRQSTCASHMVQIHQAVKQYFADEGRYPASIRDLLPADASVPVDPLVPGTEATTAASKGYLSARDSFVCPSDDTEAEGLRSSYGNLAINFPDVSKGKNGLTTTGEPDYDVDPGRWVWNAFGYDDNGWAYENEAAAHADHMDGGSECSSTSTANSCKGLVNPLSAYDAKKNPVRNSLSNRAAPPQTIITHCIYHRTWTSGLDYPGELSLPSMASNGQGARDVVLRLDGSAKLIDVSTFNAAPSQWQIARF